MRRAENDRRGGRASKERLMVPALQAMERSLGFIQLEYSHWRDLSRGTTWSNVTSGVSLAAD